MNRPSSGLLNIYTAKSHLIRYVVDDMLLFLGESAVMKTYFVHKSETNALINLSGPDCIFCTLRQTVGIEIFSMRFSEKAFKTT